MAVCAQQLNATTPQCCTTCDEIRELYRKKGWAFKPAGMAPVCPAVHPPPSLRLTFPPLLCRTRQCQREGFMESVKANRGEGCNMRGYLEVPKVGGSQGWRFPRLEILKVGGSQGWEVPKV